MSNIFEARNEVVKLASMPYKPGLGDIKYKKYDSIYLAATSNVKDTMALYSNYKSVLAVGATGAHGYEAALNGAEKIDMFDINELQRLFYLYMQTAIMYLPYEIFIKHFTLNKKATRWTRQELENLMSRELFFILEPMLDEEVVEAFGPIMMFSDGPELIMSSLFRFEHPLDINYLKKFVSFYNKDSYERLQKLLREGKVSFDYKCCSIDDVGDKFKGPYDLIVLDNIFQYYKNIRGLDTPYAVNMFINKKLRPLLSETGCIQANYGFEVATDAFKINMGLKPSKACNNPLMRFGVKIEQKEGINYNLIKKWDNYTYDFVAPVEDEFDDVQNLVLTYRPKR